ncbi:hypothetical protein GCM10010300_61620 [Streptomyces olivaceoviridis]|uniref:hypothetical protein n=1 Tax=Streptomyces olivaceoviridis TaxID=1921 RepID=UPI00167B3E29|nr:hypothetical protein [Streptomyces olivaceoviridis]GGZ09314.1 hypothetical protein GCM10010300_61620 [Streptomyces olivaceoviridis]
MNRVKRNLAVAGLATSSLVLGSFVIPGTASAAPARCNEVFYFKVTKLGRPTYKSIGPTVSKRNAASTTSTLKYAIRTDTTRSSTYHREAGGSLDWGIGKVEAKTSYDITKTVSKGRTVTNTLKVGPGKRGYTKPMVEYRKFMIDEYVQGEDCQHWLYKSYGVLKGITSSVHFAECVSKDPCTPKP